MEEGYEPTCYERADGLGGVFNTKTEAGRVYDNCHLTVSSRFMQMTSMPADQAHWHHTEYLAYIIKFAQKFDLEKYVHLGTEVTSTKRLENGEWEVTSRRLSDGKVDVRTFSALAVCCGTHQTPKAFSVPGIETFPGEIIHTCKYKNAESFRGKKVVSVGFGETAADAVAEVAKVAADMTASLRSYPLIMPRQPDHGHETSTDSHFVTGMTLLGLNCPLPIPSLIQRPIWMMLNLSGILICTVFFVLRRLAWLLGLKKLRPEKDSFGNPTDGVSYMDNKVDSTQEAYELIHTWQMLGKTSTGNKFLTKNASAVPLILKGQLKVNVSGIERIDGSVVHFKDGRSAECEMLLLCIGYTDSFDFLEEKYQPKRGVRYLFQHGLHPDPDLINLAFIGFVRPSIGGIPMCSELMARYWSMLLAGKCTLPDNVEKITLEHGDAEAADFERSAGVTSLVNLPVWNKQMMTLIGCLPKPLDILKLGPYTVYKLLTTNPFPHLTRVSGPGANHALVREGLAMSTHSIYLGKAIQFMFMNIFFHLGLCKRGYGHIFDDFGRDKTAFGYEIFKIAGESKLSEPSPKYVFDARHPLYNA